METISMPKSKSEQLSELEIGGNLPITVDERQMWANAVTQLHRDTIKQFTIRTDRDEIKQTRVWRLKDLDALA